MPILPRTHLNEEFWYCVCVLCSETHMEKKIYEPSLKRSITKKGWSWYRLAGVQLDCVCQDHLELVKAELVGKDVREASWFAQDAREPPLPAPQHP